MRDTGNRRGTVGDIQKVGVRAALPPRNEPYWRAVRPRCALGFRKGLKTGTWKARYHNDKGDQIYKSLGSELDWAGALREAEAWWTSLDAGVRNADLAVEDAVKRYVTNRGKMKGEDAEDRDDKMFKRTLYGTRLGKMPLDKMTAQDIEDWRNELTGPDRNKASANRIYRSFRAAMNYAFKHRLLALRPWEAVDAFPVADGSRQIYLTLDERREVLGAVDPELRTFLTAILLTGARPGEIEKLTVRDFDAQSKTLRLVSSKGKGGAERTRNFPLSGPSLDFFTKLADGKAKHDKLVVPTGWGRTDWSRGIRKALTKLNEGREHPLPEGICTYDFRHITISDWLQAGNDIGSVAKAAGTSVLMIDRHYHKFIPSAQDKLAAVAVL